MSQQTVSVARLERAQRALFEALGQIAIIDRMLAPIREPGQWGQGERGLTIDDPEGRFGDVRRDVTSELRTMSLRLERIDERIEELKARPEPPPLPVPGPGRP